MKEKFGSRIAVMILGPLGDVINTSGIFKQLRKYYPDAVISIITIDNALPAVKGIPEINTVYHMNKNNQSIFIKKLRVIKFGLSMRHKFDTIIVLDNSLTSAIIAFLTGAKVRIGRGRELRELLLTDIIPYLQEERNMQIPVSEHYARCLKPMGIYQENIDTYFEYKKNDAEKIQELLREYNIADKKLIGFCPACHLKKKSLITDDAADIIRSLNKNFPDFKVVIIGGSDIEDYTKKLNKYNDIEFYDFAGKTSYTESAALTDLCSKFISIDTSCMHLALALKVPVVAIFFYDIAKKWGPKNLVNNAIYTNIQEHKTDTDYIINKLKELPEKKFENIANY